MTTPSLQRTPGAASLLAALLIGSPAVLPAAEPAASSLRMEARPDGKCYNLSEGGKLVVLVSSEPTRTIRYKLRRFFAGVPQSTPVGRIAPNEPEQALGCNRVDGREQRWEVKEATFEEQNP